ncbi:30S ribosomal protein [Dirofilaria immitis]
MRSKLFTTPEKLRDNQVDAKMGSVSKKNAKNNSVQNRVRNDYVRHQQICINSRSLTQPHQTMLPNSSIYLARRLSSLID